MNNRFSWLLMLCAIFLMAISPGLILAGDLTVPPLVDTMPKSAVGGHGQLVIIAQSANYQLLKLVISGGAVEGSSTNYQMKATVGEMATGPISSASYRMSQGFWEDLGTDYVCGDANADDFVDISDVVYLIAYIFSGGSAPSPKLAGDANCDSAVDISDVVYLIAYIFSGGRAPCAVCK